MSFGMDLDLTTPALLFPGISLLFLAYTNRFLSLAGLVRELHNRYQEDSDRLLARQISNLRYRLSIIVWMQALGVGSFLLCVATMLAMGFGLALLAEGIFVAALASMLASLGCSLWEVMLSFGALRIQLADMEKN